MISYDESGATLACEFPYSEVEAKLDSEGPIGLLKHQIAEEARRESLECQWRIWDWVYDAGPKNLDGFVCRSIIACWVFVAPLRAKTMTQIAADFGKHKQSLGRWVDDFKVRFPEIANHLEHIKHE